MELKGGYDNLLKGNNSLIKKNTWCSNLWWIRKFGISPPKSSGIFKALAWIGRSLVETSPKQNLSEEFADFLPWFLQYIYIYGQTITLPSLGFHVKKLHVELLFRVDWVGKCEMSCTVILVPTPPHNKKLTCPPKKGIISKGIFMDFQGICYQLLIHWSFWLLVESFKTVSPK